ncbi:MAG TPA: long-chain fatty acid--CoA ligase [Mycobacteriales bacterium]|nr:long-chain fatty acid--CoA ligase [Mycobacteriales bacterium]
MLTDRVAASPQAEAFRWPVPGSGGAETWQSMTWAETGTRVTELAAGLLALGLRPEQRVIVFAPTRVEWVLADLAINSAAGATTTVYPSSLPEDVLHIVTDSEAVIAFVDDESKAAVLRDLADKAPDLHHVVLLDGSGDGSERELSLDALAERGRALLATDPDAVTTAIDGIGPEDLATLIYTSGTTGRPKGVRLVQDNWTYEGAGIRELNFLRPDDLQYLWLPLSHSFGKVLLAAQLEIGFATAIDGRIDKIVDNLAVVRPTFMAGAPRIFEKVHNRVIASVEAEGGIKAKLFAKAFEVGRKFSAVQQEGGKPGLGLTVAHAGADKLVLSKLRERFGGRIRVFVSGSAPLSRDVALWFHAAGMLVVEGYGMTETSAGTTVNLPGAFRFGTVGRPFPGTELSIAADGELLVRGPGVMRGYHGLPEATAETLDADGWLHTGDIGELDADGYLRITDRKKDLIKTSGGKYVAPQPIEVTFPVLCGLASQFIVHGDGRNYVTALVTLDPDALTQWAQTNAVTETDPAALARRDDIRAIVAAAVDQLNAGLNRWETVKDFRILEHDLTVESGELTPSLKLKRRVVEARYKDVLDEMYASNARPVV